MTIQNKPIIAQPLTLQDVIDGMNANPTLSVTRRRDLRSAVTCFAELTGSTPAFVSILPPSALCSI
jgi:hypothetical protein